MGTLSSLSFFSHRTYSSTFLSVDVATTKFWQGLYLGGIHLVKFVGFFPWIFSCGTCCTGQQNGMRCLEYKEIYKLAAESLSHPKLFVENRTLSVVGH